MSGSDSWAGASLITGGSGSTAVDNTGFTSETGEPIPSNGPGDGPWQSAWWKWTAPSASPVFFSTQGSRHAGGTVGMDTVLAVYTGASLAGLVEVGSNDDYAGFSGLDDTCSFVGFTPTAGVTYYIQASGYDSSEFGDLHLAWDAFVPSASPTITAPTAGASYTPGDDLAVTITWTEPGTQIDAQVIVSGAFSFASGSVGTATSVIVVFPYGTSGTVTIAVRAMQSGDDWSSYTTETITITPGVDSPAACFETDALADAPDVLWLFRDPSPTVTVADLSGNGNDGGLSDRFFAEVGYPSGSYGRQVYATSVASIPLEVDPAGGGGGASPPAFGTTGYMVVAVLRLTATTAPTLTLPTGWSIVTTQDHTATRQTIAYLLTGPATASYPWTVGVTGTISAWSFALQMFPDWLHIQPGSLQTPAAGIAVMPAPASWNRFQIQLVALFTAGAFNYINHLTPTTEWFVGASNDLVDLFMHQRIDPSNITPAIAYNSTATDINPIDRPVWLIQVVLEDGTDLNESPWMVQTDTPICDAGCADVNGEIIFRQPALSNPTASSDEGRVDSTYDLTPLTEWTIEGAARVHPFSAFPGSGGAIGAVTIGYDPTVGSFAEIHNAHGTAERKSFRQTDCWVHAVAESSTVGFADGSKFRFFVNGTLAYSDASFVALTGNFTVGGIQFEIGAAAVYPAALTKKRIAAHAAHFCHLCRGGMGFILGFSTFS